MQDEGFRVVRLQKIEARRLRHTIVVNISAGWAVSAEEVEVRALLEYFLLDLDGVADFLVLELDRRVLDVATSVVVCEEVEGLDERADDRLRGSVRAQGTARGARGRTRSSP